MNVQILFGLVALFCLASSIAAGPRRCPEACTREYNPVCGELIRLGRNLRCTFGNHCVLRDTQCRRPQEMWRIHHVGTCEGPQPVECQKIIG